MAEYVVLAKPIRQKIYSVPVRSNISQRNIEHFGHEIHEDSVAVYLSEGVSFNTTGRICANIFSYLA